MSIGTQNIAVRRPSVRTSGQTLSPAWISALVMLSAVLFVPAVLNDGDTFSHIAAGNWMIQHRIVLDHDPFSASRLGAPWIAHEWLAEIGLAVSYRVAGWSGVVALTAMAASIAFHNLGRHLSRWLQPGPVLLLLLLSAACFAPDMLARPHILALPVLEAWVAGLVIARAQGRAPSWWLVPLMCLWANLHGGFLIGLALVVPLAAEAVLASPADWRPVASRWAAFLVASTAAALVTPYGVSGLLLGFRMSAIPELSRVSEWQPTNFTTLQPLEILILIGLYMGLGRGARLAPLRLLVTLGLLHMALQHTRHTMLIGSILPLLVAEPLGAALTADRHPLRRWRVSGAGLALAALLLAIRLAVPIKRVDGPTAPISALAQMPASLRVQPVLNDYAFGGYLIFAGVKPFIDARVELYGAAALRQYAAIIHPDRAALVAALEDGKVAWTMLSPGNPAVTVMDMLPGWCRSYTDLVAVVHVRGECVR